MILKTIQYFSVVDMHKNQQESWGQKNNLRNELVRVLTRVFL